MKRKILSLFMVVATIATMTACGTKEPTAEELINGTASMQNSEVQSIDMDILMDMEMKVKIDDVTMKMKMEADVNCQSEENISYVNGSVLVEAMGMEMEQELKMWADDKNSYSYDSESENWIKSSVNQESFNLNFEKFDTELFTDLVLLESEKEATFYTVTGKVSFEDLMEITEADMSSLTGDMDVDFDWDEFCFNTTFVFDKDTKNLKEAKFEMNDSFESDDELAEISKFEISFKINSVGETLDLEIPEEVEDEAMDMVDFETDFEVEIETEDVDLSDDVTWVTEESEEQTETENKKETEAAKEDFFNKKENENAENSKIEDEIVETDITISDNWTDLQFLIDGKVIELPHSYQEFVLTGWTFNLVDYGYADGYYMNSGDKTYGTIDLENPNYTDRIIASMGVKNFGSKAVDITECSLWSWELDIMPGSKVAESHPEVIIAKGITFESTHNDVLKAFGEPQDGIYRADSSAYSVYSYNVDSYYMKLKVSDEYGLVGIELKTYE